KAAKEAPSSSTPIGHCKSIFADNDAQSVETPSNELHIISFISDHDIPVSKKENEGPSGVLSCQLPLKELNLGSFTLPSTIGSLNMYALADLDMSKKDPMGIVENILVKIDKFIFPSDFMVFDMLGDPNEAMILGIPFLANIHARINVSHREISLGIGMSKWTENRTGTKNRTETDPTRTGLVLGLVRSGFAGIDSRTEEPLESQIY
ncbi:MAK10-like protein, partial [Tanacetum coccineum]